MLNRWMNLTGDTRGAIIGCAMIIAVGVGLMLINQ